VDEAGPPQAGEKGGRLLGHRSISLSLHEWTERRSSKYERRPFASPPRTPAPGNLTSTSYSARQKGGLVAEWLACWTQAQKGPGSNRSRDAVG